MKHNWKAQHTQLWENKRNAAKVSLPLSQLIQALVLARIILAQYDIFTMFKNKLLISSVLLALSVSIREVIIVADLPTQTN